MHVYRQVLDTGVSSQADRSCFVFSEGIGAADTVWVQVVRVESVPFGHSFVVVLFDLVSSTSLHAKQFPLVFLFHWPRSHWFELGTASAHL